MYRLVESVGGKAFGYVCDLSDKNAVYNLAKRIQAEVGTVNILVNNAGIGSGSALLETSDG